MRIKFYEKKLASYPHDVIFIFKRFINSMTPEYLFKF